MKPLADSRAVTISTNLDKALPEILIDKDRIRQTLINLVHNAIKFNNTGGKIMVSSIFKVDSVTVKVADTGMGISKDDLPHIFERFYKADKARSRGGSGLGLAIAKHTVQAHNGAISAKSEEGQGTTISFSLPISPASNRVVGKINKTLTKS